jgi:hypothetical protein
MSEVIAAQTPPVSLVVTGDDLGKIYFLFQNDLFVVVDYQVLFFDIKQKSLLKLHLNVNQYCFVEYQQRKNVN